MVSLKLKNIKVIPNGFSIDTFNRELDNPKKLKEAQKEQKKAEKRQKAAEKRQKKAENEIKKKEKAKKNYSDAQDRYEKQVKRHEKLKNKGKLGGQHKVPRLQNDDTLLKEIMRHA